MSYKYFKNDKCQYFPCHDVSEEKKAEFNCLFCYCPLYCIQDCGGNYEVLLNGKKDCTSCTLPHFDFEFVISKLM